MIRKVCSKCGVEKEFCEFHKSTRCKDGYRERCKECRKVDTTLYYKNNANKIKERITKYRKNNPKKVKEGLKRYREKNFEVLKKNKKTWSKSLNGKKSKKNII
jgi:tagatose-1,6-bisphosphate aldolase